MKIVVNENLNTYDLHIYHLYESVIDIMYLLHINVLFTYLHLIFRWPKHLQYAQNLI